MASTIPINMMAGIPNLSNTVLSAFLPTRKILNRLLRKCTTPVSAMATSTGKKMANTGIRMVPRPKPEKRVSSADRKAASDMMRTSMEVKIITVMEFLLVNNILYVKTLVVIEIISFICEILNLKRVCQ